MVLKREIILLFIIVRIILLCQTWTLALLTFITNTHFNRAHLHYRVTGAEKQFCFVKNSLLPSVGFGVYSLEASNPSSIAPVIPAYCSLHCFECNVSHIQYTLIPLVSSLPCLKQMYLLSFEPIQIPTPFNTQSLSKMPK